MDACEKIISVLRHSLDDYRVIVPSWAKSAGTVIALSSSKILLGLNSELGPIDPQMRVDNMMVPCELLAADANIAPHFRALFQQATDRMRKMATDILSQGMMKGKSPPDIDAVIQKISASSGYLSHGAVIDYEEAEKLGLAVEYIAPEDELWKRVWLLYCLYDYDCKAKGLAKIFEGAKFSISRPR